MNSMFENHGSTAEARWTQSGLSRLMDQILPFLLCVASAPITSLRFQRSCYES
jgi:hypothetical protein